METKDKRKENPLFGRFDDVVKAVVNAPYLKNIPKNDKLKRSPKHSSTQARNKRL